MARFKLINGQQVPFTAQEEADRDAEEAAWAARDLAAIEAAQDAAQVQGAFSSLGTVQRAILEVQFAETNRVRAALTALGAPNMPQVTKQQFINAVLAKMRG